MHVSVGQIQTLLRQAGWPENLIVTAAAVFYYESGGGNTDAHNPGNPLGAEDSWGLAQVNRLAWPQYSSAQLRDPLFNLQVAYRIYQRQGWQAWHNTYYLGRYRLYLSASQAAYNAGQPAASHAAPTIFTGGTTTTGIDLTQLTLNPSYGLIPTPPPSYDLFNDTPPPFPTSSNNNQALILLALAALLLL